MKTKLTRLFYAGAAIVGLIGTGSVRAYFDSVANIPYPQSGRWLGAASHWNYGTNGWTYVRMSNGEQWAIKYISEGQRIDDSSWDIVDSGASFFTYKTTENYWDGTIYKYGRSRITGTPSGYASGDVWEEWRLVKPFIY